MSTKQVVLGLVVSACVVIAIVVPCALLIPDDTTDAGDLPKYTFDDIYSNKFRYESLYPRWDTSTDSSTDYLEMNSDRSILRKDVTDPADGGEQLISGKPYTDTDANLYSVSASTDYVFYRYNYIQVWRHSYTADFNIYKTSDETKVSIDGFPTDGMIQHMEWAPTGNRLAIVYKWNLWYVDLDATTPVLVQVTDDGAKNSVYNAIPDWVYEEEMTSANNVLFWSPDADKIAFLRTEEINTKIIEYSMYPEEEQYPVTMKIAYPKAGTPIGTPSLWVYDITLGEKKQLVGPTEITASDHYFARFEWMTNDICVPTWVNRVQDKSIATWCIRDDATGDFDCTLTGAGNKEDTDGKGWVGSFNPFDVVPKGTDGSYFTIYARPKQGDSDDGFWQVVLVQPGNNDAVNFLTYTEYDSVQLLHYDEANDYIYFLAVYPEARDRQVMRLSSDSKDEKEPKCMTCPLMDLYVDRCRYISPIFNAENDAVVINCRGPKVPLTVLITIDEKGDWKTGTTEVMVVKSNDDLIANQKTVAWPTREYGKFPSDSGYEFNYEIWKPADFDKNKKYPLLIEVYAGPEFQKVQSRWTEGFAQTYMVSSRDIIVASVDGRGSAYQGYKFMREVYKQLGQKEPVDQTAFANYLATEHSYIDKENMAIWGWSYGGYTTSHTLGYDAGKTFKCGVAVAPLADWRFYDAMYAERYMRTPAENDAGYTKASIVTGHELQNFKKSWYTLIHGTSDDNVHFQNAAAMEKALVEADVDFDDFFYADQAHSINTGNGNQHVYRQIDFRLSTCLGKIAGHFPENVIDMNKSANPKIITK